MLLAVPTLRGGREVIDRAVELDGDRVGAAVARLREVADGIAERGLLDRVIFDLGLVRELGYYTGAVFEVYDPALGHVLGGGGRYDELLGRFGRSLPAAASALFVERMHVAQAEEERRMPEGGAHERAAPLAISRGTLFEETLDRLDACGIDTSPRCARTRARCSSRASR